MANRSRHYQTRHKHDLTPRQQTVLELMAEGRTNAEIAARLGLTLDGAKWHVSEILSRLNLTSREEAIAWWHEYHGWPARVSRRLALLVTPGAWKIAAAAGGAAAATAAVAVAIVSFQTGGESAAEDAYPACAMENVRWEPAVEHAGGATRITVAATLRHPDWYEGFVRAIGLSDRQVASPCQLRDDASFELVLVSAVPPAPSANVIALVPAGKVEAVTGNPAEFELNSTLKIGTRAIVVVMEVENWCRPSTAVAGELLVPAVHPGGPPATHLSLTVPLGDLPPCLDPAGSPRLTVSTTP